MLALLIKSNLELSASLVFFLITFRWNYEIINYLFSYVIIWDIMCTSCNSCNYRRYLDLNWFFASKICKSIKCLSVWSLTYNAMLINDNFRPFLKKCWAHHLKHQPLHTATKQRWLLQRLYSRLFITMSSLGSIMTWTIVKVWWTTMRAY